MNYIIPFKKLSKYAIAPFHAHPTDAGWDLYIDSIVCADDHTITYGSGLAFDFSSVGFCDVRARSSVCRHGMMLVNGCGVIDAGYRGEVTGVFHVYDQSKPCYSIGDRFLQMLFPMLTPEDTVDFVEVDELPSSDRGTGGYGSTGA